MHSSVIGLMPAELMYGQKPIMPVERTISSWTAIDWTDEMNREELLVARIPTTRAETGGHGTSEGEAVRGKGEEQGPV